MMKMDFSLSRVADGMFRMADIEPARVNRIVDRRIAEGKDASLRPGHYYTSCTRRATGVPLRGIWRRNRHLLIQVENHEPFWRYIEWSRNECFLLVPGHQPETVAAAMTGQPLRRFVGDHSLLADCIVLRVGKDGGFARLDLEPGWTRHGSSLDGR